MANLNTEGIKKIKRGEAAGYVATAICGVVLIYFIIAFTVAQVYDLYALRLVTLVVSPVMTIAGIAVSAYCNLHFGTLIERVISRYVHEILLENATIMHPEKEKLTFNVIFDGDTFFLGVNGYKERIVFDFSAFGKISVVRRSQIISAIINRLSSTFFNLYSRGAKYSYVGYSVCTPSRTGKPVDLIVGGEPERNAFKAYLKAQ